MKILIGLTVATLLAFSFNTQSVEPENEDLISRYCESLRTFSVNVMRFRQNGGDIRAMLDIVENNENPALKEIVLQAYRNPEMQTQTHKDRFVREFSTKIYLGCLGIE